MSLTAFNLLCAAQVCDSSAVKSLDDVYDLRAWLGGAWDYMAMGNFPYPSAYILNGDGALPAFPVRVACSHLEDPHLVGEALLGAMAQVNCPRCQCCPSVPPAHVRPD